MIITSLFALWVVVDGNCCCRCDAGLAGLQKQGVCNSFLSKMIMKCDQVFMVCCGCVCVRVRVRMRVCMCAYAYMYVCVVCDVTDVITYDAM